MQREFVQVPDYFTVGDTIDYLRATPEIPDDFYSIFVVDNLNKPLGVLDLNKLVRNKRKVYVGDLVNNDVINITTGMDREDVAYLFRKRDLLTLPVVENNGKLIGQITIDDIVDVIDEEAQEDIYKLAGVGDSNLYSAVLGIVKGRFTWLMLNLI